MKSSMPPLGTAKPNLVDRARYRSDTGVPVAAATVGLTLALLTCGGLFAQGPTPGTELQVNTYTTSIQGKPNAAIGPDGSSVVVWHSIGSVGNDSSIFSIQAQRFAAGGTMSGAQFQVNTYTTNLQINPDVAMRDDGSFLVVWESVESSSGDNDNGIHGQLFSADGSPIGGQFPLNSYTTSSQSNPVISFAPSGEFVATWESYAASPGNDTDESSIVARRFDASGNPLASDFQVNTDTTNTQLLPDIAHDGVGDFVIVWTGDDGSASGIAGQRYDSGGMPLGGEFQVNTLTTFYQATVTVDSDPQGNFVVTWQSFATTGTDGDTDTSIQARRYQDDGTPLAPEFQVNTTTTDYQRPSSVAVQKDSSFLVAWQSETSAGTDSDADSIQLQWYAADGSPRGGELQVNSFTPGEQEEPNLALSRNGDAVVVWESTQSGGTDSDAGSIQARWFMTTLFLDGFESGDTSAWSNVVP